MRKHILELDRYKIPYNSYSSYGQVQYMKPDYKRKALDAIVEWNKIRSFKIFDFVVEEVLNKTEETVVIFNGAVVSEYENIVTLHIYYY